jgi:hypothetical protein
LIGAISVVFQEVMEMVLTEWEKEWETERARETKRPEVQK